MRRLPIVGQKPSEKTLMPEVLPQPAGMGAGSPRQRTVLHMRRLLAAAAVAGIAATTTSRSGAAGDGGVDGAADGPTEGAVDDGATDAGAHDANGDASEDADAGNVGNPYYDARPGYDPAGPPPQAGTNQTSGCGCRVVGEPGRK
jgi:hypothetical protein